MQDIKKREQKMKEMRKNTDFRDFLKEICSRYPMVLYKNNGKISKHPQVGRKNNLISFSEFDDIRDDLVNNTIDYNINKSFFNQYWEFFKNAKFPLLSNYAGSEDCEFADAVLGSKTVYLSFWVISDCENILYSVTVKNHCTNILNWFWIVKSENVYSSSWITNSYEIFYSRYLNNCSNVRFSANLNWCNECILCHNLDNKSYCIKNIEYSKEEYFEIKQKLLLQKENFDSRYQNLEMKLNNFASKNVAGVNIVESTNITNWYNLNQVDTWNNLICVGGRGISKNMYDVYGSTPECIDTYWSTWVWVWTTNIYNSSYTVGSSNIYYSSFIESCSYCLWCVWLRNKSFCILNKQYTKEERFELASQIFTKMEEDWELWKFFTSYMNPYYFNDTVAYLIDDSFTKQEVEAEWYLRRDEKIKVDIPKWADLIKSADLDQYQWLDSNWNRQINPEILKKVIIDKKWNYYRIVKLEYDFLMKHGLPLPEIHWLDRIKLWFKFEHNKI